MVDARNPRDAPHPDGALLEAWRGGDQSAGEHLFNRYAARLLRFFRTKVDTAAEDLVQRTFMTCVRRRDFLRDDSSFRAYLFRVARNELHRHLERSVRRAFDPLVTSVVHLQESPSERLANRDNHSALVAALTELPIDLQIALELYYWEELSVPELADVLAIPEGTVKSRLFRARSLLRAQLEAQGAPAAAGPGATEGSRSSDPVAPAAGVRPTQWAEPTDAHVAEGLDDWAASIRQLFAAAVDGPPRREPR